MESAYRPDRHYRVPIPHSETHLWLVIKNVDGDEFGVDGDGKALIQKFVNVPIPRIIVLRQKNPMTIIAQFQSEDLKCCAKYEIDGKSYGRRLLNALDYKTSDTPEVSHRLERFNPTPYQAERTIAIKGVKHAGNRTFPLKEFTQMVRNEFCDPKLIVSVGFRQNVPPNGDTLSIAFVVFHDVEHVKRAVQKRFVFFEGQQLPVNAYERQTDTPRQRIVQFLNSNLVRVVEAIDKTHLLVRANPQDFNDAMANANKKKLSQYVLQQGDVNKKHTVLVQVDGRYVRAQLLFLHDNGSVEVDLIDLGRRDTIAIDALYQCENGLQHYARMAHEVEIINFIHLGNQIKLPDFRRFFRARHSEWFNLKIIDYNFYELCGYIRTQDGRVDVQQIIWQHFDLDAYIFKDFIGQAYGLTQDHSRYDINLIVGGSTIDVRAEVDETLTENIFLDYLGQRCVELEYAKHAVLAALSNILPTHLMRFPLDGTTKLRVTLRSDTDDKMQLSGGSLALSIGIAICSLVLGKSIVSKMTFTGGLDGESGAIQMVGGLEEKAAASINGLRPVIFIPFGCEAQISNNVRANGLLKVVPVISIEQAIEFAFNLNIFD